MKILERAGGVYLRKIHAMHSSASPQSSQHRIWSLQHPNGHNPYHMPKLVKFRMGPAQSSLAASTANEYRASAYRRSMGAPPANESVRFELTSSLRVKLNKVTGSILAGQRRVEMAWWHCSSFSEPILVGCGQMVMMMAWGSQH